LAVFVHGVAGASADDEKISELIEAWIEHLPGGVDWAIVFNSGHHKAPGMPNPIGAARRKVAEAVERLTEWPDVDLKAGTLIVRRSKTAAGVRAIVHPGGSIRDKDTVELCKEAGVTLYLTGARHFAH